MEGGSCSFFSTFPWWLCVCSSVGHGNLVLNVLNSCGTVGKLNLQLGLIFHDGLFVFVPCPDSRFHDLQGCGVLRSCPLSLASLHCLGLLSFPLFFPCMSVSPNVATKRKRSGTSGMTLTPLSLAAWGGWGRNM